MLNVLNVFNVFNVFNVLSSFWWLIPFLLIVFIFSRPGFKGLIGEFLVNLSIKLFLNKNDYHLIKNVTLPTEDGTTQIDHIIVSRFGVFVIETKNMKGWIFGSEKQKQWTQQIFKVKNKFQNPLHQNFKHTRTLQDLLGLTDEQVHSLIIFIGNCTFKTDMPENVKRSGYITYIKSFTREVLNKGEVIEVTEKIEAGRLERSFKTNREHVKHVKEIVAVKESEWEARNDRFKSFTKEARNEEEVIEVPEKNETDKQEHSFKTNREVIKQVEEIVAGKESEMEVRNDCSKCGSPMVERITKKGENKGNKFWGCSAFPKCRNIMAIE